MPPHRVPSSTPLQGGAVRQTTHATLRGACTADFLGEPTTRFTTNVPKKPWRASIRSIEEQYFLLLLFEFGITPCSAAAWCHCPARCRWRTTGCAACMHGRSAAAMSWRSGGNRLMMASQQYNLPRVIAINLAALAAIAAQVVPRRAGVTHGNPPEAAHGQGVLRRQYSC
jgi:hypothetical protein